VTLGSLGLGLWLFFRNTVPAVDERDHLVGLEQDLVQTRQQYDAWITQARLGHGATADFDLQSLFVAIDRKGYTPAEFCAAYPSSASDDDDANAGDPRAKIR
jgi:hypothetical protein